MKENYDYDQLDLDQNNQSIQPNQKSKSVLDNNQNLQESSQISEFTVLIHFSITKTFSFTIPNTWTTKKLLSFIILTFKSEFKNSIPIFLYNGNILQPFSETELKEYFNPYKINNIIITLKEKEKNAQKEENNNNTNTNNNKNILDILSSKSNKEVFKTEEFCYMERDIINDYNKIFKEDSLINFPLMSPAYNQRRQQIKYDSQTEKLAQFEPIPLEDFPLMNYFQLKIIFKILISFIGLGVYIKGFNFVLFLCVLVIYYWYCIGNIIDEFYKKKFQEIGLSEEEYKRIGNEIKDIGKKYGRFIIDKDDEEDEEDNESDNGNKDENDNDKNNNNEDIIYEEKTDDNISNNNINREANNINIDLEEDIKEPNLNINNIIKEPMKDLEFKEDSDNKNGQILNNNNKNLNKKKKKEIKKENEKEEEKENEHEEPERETALQIAYQIIYLFFISFIPPWCDEFEAQNPMPANNQQNININDNNINNEGNLNLNNNNDENNIINENNINNNLNNEINNDNNIGQQQQSNSSQQEDESNNNKKTSSKVVNISEDSNRDSKMFNLIKKDNQSLNENEYVFSENGGIDSLSMNSEIYKQKKEKEKEKEKENKDNKEKEKEEQIFEEEEEKIIEKDEHLKNE